MNELSVLPHSEGESVDPDLSLSDITQAFRWTRHCVLSTVLFQLKKSKKQHFFWHVTVATSGFIRMKQIALQRGSCVWRTFFLKRERRKHMVLSVLTAAFLPTHTHQYHPPSAHTHRHTTFITYVHSTCTHFSSCWQQLLCNSPGWTEIYEGLVGVGGGLCMKS